MMKSTAPSLCDRRRLLCLFLLVLSCHAEALKKTFTLMDSWDGEDGFRKRGQVTLSVAQDGDLQVELENQTTPPDAATDGLYQVKLVDDSNPDQYAMTSVSACQLRRANFRDELILTLGPSGSIVSVAYEPLVSPLAPTCRELSEGSTLWRVKDQFDSKIMYETSTAGMTLPVIMPHSKPPAGMKFFPRSSKDASFDPNVEPEAPKSFFQRYWYIIAGFFVMQLLQSGGGGGEEAAQQEQVQSGAGEQQGSGGAVSSASGGGAPASPSAGGGVRRRGKRG